MFCNISGTNSPFADCSLRFFALLFSIIYLTVEQNEAFYRCALPPVEGSVVLRCTGAILAGARIPSLTLPMLHAGASENRFTGWKSSALLMSHGCSLYSVSEWQWKTVVLVSLIFSDAYLSSYSGSFNFFVFFLYKIYRVIQKAIYFL